MLIRKLFKRSKPVLAPAAKGAVAPHTEPANPLEQGFKERRSFPRPLPVAEVMEQDWNTWVNVTQEQRSSRSE